VIRRSVRVAFAPRRRTPSFVRAPSENALQRFSHALRLKTSWRIESVFVAKTRDASILGPATLLGAAAGFRRREDGAQ
jgi:hypothetical protein